MKKLLCGFLLLVSALAHFTLAGAASTTLGQAGPGGVSAIISPDPGEIGRPANIWMGGVLNGILFLRSGPTNWVVYQGGTLPIALTSAALPSSLQVSIVNFDVSSVPGLDVYVGYGSTEADLSRSGHLAKVYTTVLTPAATAVGVASGSAASATIGAAGGSVSTPDGKIALTIPAGALASNTVISIQPLTNTAHGKIGAGYRLTPGGQTFLTPITLTFPYTDQDLLGTAAEVLGAAFQTADGYWRWAGDATIDTTAKTVSVRSTHFSDWSLVKGFQIRPQSKTVRVNGTVGLRVKYCYDPESSDLAGYECDDDADLAPLLPTATVTAWSVNGVPGGSGATGTVSGNGPAATYTAPATKPNPNVVAVSARIDRGARKTLVVSNITITDGFTYTGTVHFSIGTVGTTNGVANVTWTPFAIPGETAGDTHRFVPSGTITADFAPADCDSVHATVPIQATVPGGPGPTMVVYTASNAAFPNRHQFGLAAAPGTILTFSCGNPRHTFQFPASVLTAFIVGICTSPELQPYTDEAHLTGTYGCAVTGLGATWDFIGQ
jgi:hypothetical protein